MIELKDGIILSKNAPKELVSLSFDKGKVNTIPLSEAYKYTLLKLKDQAIDKGIFKIDDVQVYPSEENEKTLFFLQVNSLIKLGLCFVCEKENKRKLVKQIEENLLTLRELPAETIEEKNTKIAAIFAKIRELSPSYIITDLNDCDKKLIVVLKDNLEAFAKDFVVVSLERKASKDEEEEKDNVDSTIGSEETIDVIEKEAKIDNLDIGQKPIETKEKLKEGNEDFIVFDLEEAAFSKCLGNTFKNNAMVFLSFIIPATGVTAFALLSPLYSQTQNQVLLIPFIITIVICFVLYFIMTYKCTKFNNNKNDPSFKKKMAIFNILNIIATVIGIGLGIGIFILFKKFDAELKLITSNNILGIILALVLAALLLTANLYIFVVINKIKQLLKRKK